MRKTSDNSSLFPAAPARAELTHAQRIAWLRLIRSENVGPVTFRDLVNHYGGAEAALEALPELSRRGGRRGPIRIAGRGQAEREAEAAAGLGAELIAIGEAGYPPWLQALDAPPPLLYVKGRLELTQQPIVAMVGARNASAAGRKFARIVSESLGRDGVVVGSGLARGIDQAAHSAALEQGTIAVLAGGIDMIYPPEHAELYHAIAERGVLISESPPGMQARGRDFPRRNRIIAGMAMAVVVVEAARRSGSLITARMALEQGREVLATPGNPLDPRAQGTNGLIKDGAAVCTGADDVVEVISRFLGGGPSEPQPVMAEPGSPTEDWPAVDLEFHAKPTASGWWNRSARRPWKSTRFAG